MGVKMKSIYDQDYIEIITRLRAKRNEAKMTQQDLAQIMGVSQSFISKVENCERRLDVMEFLNWLESLQLSYWDVLPAKYNKGE